MGLFSHSGVIIIIFGVFLIELMLDVCDLKVRGGLMMGRPMKTWWWMSEVHMVDRRCRRCNPCCCWCFFVKKKEEKER